MKREPRLQFTDEERAAPELKKTIQKVDKAAAKADIIMILIKIE